MSHQSTDLSDLITASEAARLRNVTRSAIAALIKRGRLKTVQIGGRPFLLRSEVEGFEPDRPGPKVTPDQKRVVTTNDAKKPPTARGRARTTVARKEGLVKKEAK